MKRIFTCVISLVLVGLMSGCALAANRTYGSTVVFSGAITGGGSEADGADKAPAVNYDSNIAMMVRYDYDDKVRAGVAAPAFIDIENKGDAIEGILRLSITPYRSDEANVYEMPVHIGTESKASFTLPFFCRTRTQNIKVHLLRNGEAVAEAGRARTRVLQTGDMLIGILSSSPDSMGYRSSLTSILDENSRAISVVPVDLTADDMPEQFYMLDRFALIVLNHFDLGYLNEAQKQVLADWVTGGGRLLVDADINNVQAVASLSPILPLAVNGGLPAIDDIAQLEAMTKQSFEEDIKGPGALGKIEPAGKLVVGSAETPLITEHQAGKGKVFTTAFALDDPFLKETNAAAVFKSIRGLSAWDATSIELLDVSYHSSSYSIMGDAVRSIEWLDAPSVSWILVMLLGFIVIAGPVSYIILRKRDKRDLIWLTAPALALICCVVIVGYGVSRHGTQTVSSVVTVIDSRGNASGAHNYSVVGIAAPQKGSYALEFEEDSFPYRMPGNDYYYYGYDSTEEEEGVGKPAFRIDTSGYPKVTFQEIPQWNMDAFYLQRDLTVAGELQGRIQYQADGVHYYVRNDTGADLEDVTVISQLGYQRIPLLESGGEASGVMEQYAYQQSQPGGTSMYYQYGNDYWNVLNELYGGPNANSYGIGLVEDNRTEDEQREDYLKSCMVNSLVENSNMRSSGMYTGMQYDIAVWGWSRELGALPVTANGKAVRNDLNRAVVVGSMEVEYESNGEIVIPLGQITGAIVESEDVLGGSAVVGERQAYFTSGEVVFGFDLPETVEKYKLDRLTVSSYYTYGNYTSLLYNNRTGEWDKFYFDNEVTGDTVGDYADADGRVLVKISSEVADEDMQGNMGEEINVDTLLIGISGKER